MGTLTMAQVRRDARTRLIMMAEGNPKFRGPYDPDRLTSDSLHILKRWALENALAGGDRVEVERARTDIDKLVPVAKGDTVELSDTAAAGGVGALLGDDEPPAPTVDELEAALTRMLGVSADG